MSSIRSDRRLLSALMGFAGIAFMSSRSPGDVVVAQWFSSTNYTYWIDHVPDFDQRRSALPNNGNMYCVPTACMNWMAYVATHGDPSMAPGLANWQSQSNYDTATASLLLMGLLMSTDPNDGTSGSNGLSGVSNWVANSDKPYIVFRYSQDWDWAPTLRSCAHHGIQGALVAPCVGWYDLDDYPLIDRDGGHCMSLALASHSGGQMNISVMDPATGGGNNMTQSTFTIDSYSVQLELVRTNPFGPWKIMNKINGLSSASTGAYLDSIYTIYPAFILSTFQQPTTFEWTFAHLPWGSSSEPSRSFTAPAGKSYVDLSLHADASTIFAIVTGSAGPNEVYEINPVSNEWTQVEVVMEDARRLHVSRMRDLYVIDGDDVVCIAVDPEIPEETTRVTLPSPPMAITSNDATNQIAVMTMDDLYLYPYDLAGAPTVLPLPGGLPTDLIDGGVLRYDPVRRGYWLVSPTDDMLHLLTDNGSGALNVTSYGFDTIIEPWSIDVGDDGRLYVSTQGQIAEFELNEKDTLVEVTDPHYADVEAGAFLQVARSRTNHDPAQHEGPAWRHRLPDTFNGSSTPVCAADIDDDGTIGVTDLLALLAAWGPCPTDSFCHADVDFSGAVDVNDLLELLGAWGPCQ